VTDSEGASPDLDHERAREVVVGWDRQGRLDAVRTRVGVLALAGIVLFFGRFVVETSGLTRLVVQAWTLLTLPVTVVATSLSLTLRSLDRPEELLDPDGTVAFVAVWALALLAIHRERSTAGRVAWRLLLNHPPESSGFESDGEPHPTAERAVRYVRYAVLGSGLVVLADQAWKREWRVGDVSAPAVDPTALTGGDGALLLAGAVLLGAVVGFLLAVARA
jgi:hypothetical protein